MELDERLRIYKDELANLPKNSENVDRYRSLTCRIQELEFAIAYADQQVALNGEKEDDYAKYGWDTKGHKTPLQITCKVRTECVGYNGYYLTEDNAIEAIKKYASQIEHKRKAQVDFYKRNEEQLENVIRDHDATISDLQNQLKKGI